MKSPASEPDKKRVRFDPPAPSTEADSLQNDSPDQPKKSTLRANTVIQFRFISSPSEIPSDPNAPFPSKQTAHPTYLHQIFPNELVHGWQTLNVAVYIHMSSLSTHIVAHGVPCTAQHCSPTDVPKLLTPFIQSGLYALRSQFDPVVSAPYVMPVKTQVASYTHDRRHFAIYKERFFKSDSSGTLVHRSDFLAYHLRMAFLMFVHIDGASFIDHEDPRWEVFVVAELIDQQPRNFIGYATTYPFSALASGNDKSITFSERIRISQVIVSPLAQGYGHGGRLLSAIYDDALKRKAMEVTVEDPSRPFRILRDLTDLRRCYALNLLNANHPLDMDQYDQLMITLRKDLLLTPGQAMRCAEVHQLSHTNREDELKYKKYRLWVKRRLYKDYLEVLDKYEAEEKKEKLAQIYQDYEEEYLEAILRLEGATKRSDRKQ